MTLDKISLTLYDFLGYLLPGYIWLLTLSLTEATFIRSDIFSFDHMGESGLFYAIVAYFLGHLSHAIGSLLKDWNRDWFSDYQHRLSDSLKKTVKQAISEAHGITAEETEKLNSLETYMLADSYVIASGGAAERDVIMAREGFHKATMVAFGQLAIALLASAFAGGVTLQVRAGSFVQVPVWPTVGLGVLAVLVALVFKGRFAFYGRVKVNNTQLLFLSLYQKDKQKKKE